MTHGQPRGFMTHTLRDVQRYPSGKTPARHQEEALSALRRWFRKSQSPKGGILVLPTGGGKTFTATRFLTEGPLSQGHKVLWLAHTHHLLDQAFAGFGRGSDGRYEIGHVSAGREKLTFRTVSGTVGHGRPSAIKATDDVVIITLQTLARAMQAQVHRGLQEFLASSRQVGLTVVFDECHHAPAPSFRRLIEALRQAVPDLHLLGLTATPTYTDERRQGYLRKLFPQAILYQANPQELMLAGVLAKPIVEEPVTHVQPDFTDQDFQQWLGTHRDIPEKVIAHLAQHRERNAMIADTYARNRERYGQTIIFADRWYQCTALVELLRQRGVRADAVFSHQDAQLGTADARAARTADENETVLAQFKRGELDVIVNIRMLTEGTDVPNAQTVFLTRQTTSRILLTQMIGRALRGPSFGGTADAYIVAFIDEWKQHINWARWDDILDLDVEDGAAAVHTRLPVEVISTDLIAHLARDLDARDLAAVPFLSLLPLGWYAVSYDALVQPSGAATDSAAPDEDASAILENEEATDNVETVRQLIPVYSRDEGPYQRLFRELDRVNLSDFEDIELSDEALLNLRGWVTQHFPAEDRLTPLHQDVLSVVRHRARNGSWPAFVPFDARKNHNIDDLAQDLALDRQLSRRAEDQALREEFASPDRLWQTLYRNYDQFKRQYDASVNRLLYLQDHPEAVPVIEPELEPPELLEVPADLKAKIKRRDKVCLCCGAKSRLQVDHIRSRYAGGTHAEDNLQLLCQTCNTLKGIKEIDFRVKQSPLHSPEEVRTNADWIFRRTGETTKSSFESALQRITNMALQCAAVTRVFRQTVAAADPDPIYIVRVSRGNEAAWVQPVLDQAHAIWARDIPGFAASHARRIVAAPRHQDSESAGG